MAIHYERSQRDSVEKSLILQLRISIGPLSVPKLSRHFLAYQYIKAADGHLVSCKVS